jgi:hypothetical protein
MAELVDHLLLGLVDCLVPLCRPVYRARLQGSDDSTVLSVVLLVPVSVVVLWMGIFGSAAIGLQR